MVKKLFAKGGRAVVADIPEPELRPGEVLIAPAFSVVSAGTETATSSSNPALWTGQSIALRPAP